MTSAKRFPAVVRFFELLLPLELPGVTLSELRATLPVFAPIGLEGQSFPFGYGEFEGAPVRHL
ncbi:hypothetical protein PV419_07605 [Streptomyces sp. ME19-01-6]|nr:hypothetical protein [Streptomyces sp. ME19-01-6]MDX3225568.1 hypothetical protein [Streptomyces sp. ME19-01-6]